jgi:hypothetical protein
MPQSQARTEHLRVYVRDHDTLEKFLQNGKAALRQAWHQVHPDPEEIGYSHTFDEWIHGGNTQHSSTNNSQKGDLSFSFTLKRIPDETRGKPSDQSKIMHYIWNAFKSGAFNKKLTLYNMVKVVQKQFKQAEEKVPSEDAINKYAKLWKLKRGFLDKIQGSDVKWLVKHFPREIKLILANHVINPLRKSWEDEINRSEDIKNELDEHISDYDESEREEAKEDFLDDLLEQHQQELIEKVGHIIDTTRNLTAKEQKTLTTEIFNLFQVHDNAEIIRLFEEVWHHTNQDVSRLQ